jgi:hypothetical protein
MFLSCWEVFGEFWTTWKFSKFWTPFGTPKYLENFLSIKSKTFCQEWSIAARVQLATKSSRVAKILPPFRPLVPRAMRKITPQLYAGREDLDPLTFHILATRVGVSSKCTRVA